ncbi:hypothetical protein QL285_010514 [Trifolium repens]|jgi:hypothetical protein|nr:hypothetical protein QL285_010514 [Trifolium repens]
MDFVIPNKHQHPATTPTHNRGGAALPNHPHNLRRGHTTTVSDETTTTNVHIEQISVTGTKRRTQQRKHRRERVNDGTELRSSSHHLPKGLHLAVKDLDFRDCSGGGSGLREKAERNLKFSF